MAPMNQVVRHTRRVVQVILLGHRLSSTSKRVLRQELGAHVEIVVYYAPLHITRWDRVDLEVVAHLKQLVADGVDVSGATPTVFQPSGSSVASLAWAYGWNGLAGKPARVVNLTNQGPSVGYAPSPEKPFLDLDNIVDPRDFGLADAAAAAGEVQAHVIDLHSIKSQVGRARRAELTTQGAYAHTVETL